MSDVHTIASIDLKKIEHSFGIVTSKRQYYVRASNTTEMQDWIDALRDVLEQVRQRMTITRGMGNMDVSEGNNQEQAPAKKVPSAVSSGGKTPNSTHQSAPISIVIPGKGLYKSPAQPRITTSGTVLSPLSATSDSEAGGPSAAEQFGLSYASSAGQSYGSSPSKLQHHDHSSGGYSPQNLSGGDEEASRRSRQALQPAHATRETSLGSSVDEQTSMTGSTAKTPKGSSFAVQQTLSSSEDEAEGDDWDEDEEADRAMPLPVHAGGFHHGALQAVQSGQSLSMPPNGSNSTSAFSQQQATKSKVVSEFLKDPNKIIHQGYLMKQSNRRKHWRKRWFILTSGHLSYTRSHMDARSHRQIPISSILDAIEYTSKKVANPAPLSPSLAGNVSGGGGNSMSYNFSPQLGSGIDDRKENSNVQSEVSNAKEGAPVSSDDVQTPSTERRNPTSAVQGQTTERRSNSTVAQSPTVERRNTLGTPGNPSTGQPGSTPKKKKENCFKIITPKRTYLVCAPTEEDEIKWLSALQALILHWREEKEGVASPPSQGEYLTGNQTQTSHQSSSVSPPTMATALGRLNAPGLSLPRPLRRGSHDDGGQMNPVEPR